jgi:phage terminase large subunit GpA-like protein
VIAFAAPQETDVSDLLQAAGFGFEPDPDLRCDEWAEQRRYLTRDDSKVTGLYKFDPIPWARDIARALSPQVRIRRVVWRSSSQTAKTAMGLNFIGCAVDISPGPILIVQPTQSTAKTFSTQRLRPMIRASPTLREKVKDGKGRDGGNSTFEKQFAGGAIFIAWAGSADELASKPIRYIMADEVSKWRRNLDNQGDALAQAVQRTQNYGPDAKVFIPSTPTEEGSCTVTEEYEAGDQRKIEVPCPHCDGFQQLEWEQIHWEKKEVNGRKVHLTDTAAYFCKLCGSEWTDAERLAAIQRYRWVAHRWGGIDGNVRVLTPEDACIAPGGVASFDSWCLYTPWENPVSLAAEFVKCIGHPDKMRAFVNLKLGRPYKPAAIEFDARDLMGRRRAFAAEVPEFVALLTASVDVQGDRLEVLLMGWGAGEESAVILHTRIHGDPEQAEVWQRLESIITKRYTHELGGTIRVRMVCCDGRHKPEAVAKFVRPREHRPSATVSAIHGHDNRAKELIHRPEKPNKFGIKPVTLATHQLKDTMLPRLLKSEPGPGYIHFAAQDSRIEGMDANFFEQFSHEKRVKERNTKGRYEWRWKAIHERTEAIDLMCYAYAALLLLGPAVYENLERWHRRLARRAATSVAAEDAVPAPVAEPVADQPAAGKKRAARAKPAKPGPGRSGSWATRGIR